MAEASGNPYRANGGPPVLRRSVFALVDILGYRDLIEAAGGAVGQQVLLRRLHAALSSSREWLDGGCMAESTGTGPDRFSLKAFTDNIAIGWPISGRGDGEVELGMAFDDLSHFQLTLVNEGFFVRGAVSVGDAYVDEIAVFGEALLEAYRGESGLARDPRIVLTESARKYARAHVHYYLPPQNAPQNRMLMRDTDGQWFLNYLDTIFAPGTDPMIYELERHKAAVESRLGEYRRRPTVFSKYAWTAGYHNDFCERNGFDDWRVDIAAFAGSRGFIVEEIRP